MNDVDLAKLRKIYRLLYQQPTMRRVVDVTASFLMNFRNRPTFAHSSVLCGRIYA